jgi:hypothetical protein
MVVLFFCIHLVLPFNILLLIVVYLGCVENGEGIVDGLLCLSCTREHVHDNHQTQCAHFVLSCARHAHAKIDGTHEDNTMSTSLAHCVVFVHLGGERRSNCDVACRNEW